MIPFRPFFPSYTIEYRNKVRTCAENLLKKTDVCKAYPYTADRAKKALDSINALDELYKWIEDNADKAEVINFYEYKIPFKNIVKVGDEYKVIDTYVVVKRVRENSFVGKDSYLNGTWECIVRLEGNEFGRDILCSMEIIKNQDSIDRLEELCRIKNETRNLVK